MIPLKEIQIGNIVWCATMPMIVTEVSYTGQIKVGDGIHCTNEQIEPIPLTPEFIMQCGGEVIGQHNNMVKLIRLGTLLLHVGDEVDFKHSDDGNVYWVAGLSYVHDLQNLFSLLNEGTLWIAKEVYETLKIA